jgi:hypothetical protein
MSGDAGTAADRMAVRALTHAYETGGHRTQFRVEKWDADQIGWTRRRLDIPARSEPSARSFRQLNVRPFDTYVKDDCNLIQDAGWQLLMNGLAGTAITKFSATVGRIGGGITGTAATYTQNDLLAATGAANRQWELVSSTPTVGATHTAGLVFAATFPTTDGNFAWAEFAVDQGTAAGTAAATAVCLSRGVASPGTKTSAQTWNVTVTIGWT